MVRIAADVTWLVGRTPLMELSRLSPPGSRILGKLDAWNPSGSNKDRAALGMIRHAERSGFLRPGGTIVECSSGDLGLAIATIGRRLGYRVVLTMPAGPERERRRRLEMLGAEVVVADDGGMRGAMALAEVFAKQTPGGICLQAFTNRANARIHAETTAREIWEDTDGQVDVVVVPVGTGGTAAGCVTFFGELEVDVVAVQPAASAVLTGGPAGPHGIPGLGAGFIPDILDPTTLSAIVAVREAEALEGVRALAASESLLVGPASGAVAHAAVALARQPEARGKMIVAVLPDRFDAQFEHGEAQESR